LRYAKAAAYWQKAAALLPENKKQERSLCLHEAGYDLDRVSRHSEALPLYEQSLAINREIDKKQEGVSLNLSLTQVVTYNFLKIHDSPRMVYFCGLTRI
jgi:hypothetical protein